MSWIGDRREMEAFVRAVELGSYSAAARELRLSPSAVSKLVGRLEQALGAHLLNRTTRNLTLTAEGELFIARCRKILAEMEDAENEVRGSRARPRGRLRLHVGTGFGVHLVVPALPRFFERYPEIRLDLVVEDRHPDLVKEGIDLTVRPGPPDPALVVRTVFEFERVVCAAPAYLGRCGMPRSPDDLADHSCLGLSSLPRAEWPFTTPTGRRVVEIVPSIAATNVDCVLRFALMGLGIVRLNEFIVAEDFRRGALVPVLAEFHCAEAEPMLAMYPHMRHRLPRVAAMLEFMAEAFAHRPWRPVLPRRPGDVMPVSPQSYSGLAGAEFHP
jgi:DNA-binding transcriptional LysR family regulator